MELAQLLDELQTHIDNFKDGAPMQGTNQQLADWADARRAEFRPLLNRALAVNIKYALVWFVANGYTPQEGLAKIEKDFPANLLKQIGREFSDIKNAGLRQYAEEGK